MFSSDPLVPDTNKHKKLKNGKNLEKLEISNKRDRRKRRKLGEFAAKDAYRGTIKQEIRKTGELENRRLGKQEIKKTGD